MDRKGIVFTRPRDTVSFFLGLILAAFGALPLLSKFGLLKLAFVDTLMKSITFNIAIWIIAVAGLYIVIDGFIEPPAHSLHWFLIIAGIVMFVVGLIPLLFSFKVISLDLGSFLNNLYAYQSIITVEGLLLMIGGLTEH